MYKVKDFNDETIESDFYENDMQKVYKEENSLWLVEKLIRKRKRRGQTEWLVKFQSWPDKFNLWVKESDIADLRKMMEKFIFARSTDPRIYFPDNKHYNFKIHLLDKTLDLTGYWKVFITEYFTTSSPKSTVIDKLTSKPIVNFNRKPVYVSTDICSFSSVHGQEQPLLRINQADASYR